MSAPTAASPLEHIGVPYEDPESLVASIGPRVADAITGGDDVYLSVDRRTARAFRDWLGPAGRGVSYPSPSAWPQDIVRDVRAVARGDRRALVLGQYTASGVDGPTMNQVEEGVNLVLGDVPVTILCTCAEAASPALGSALRSGHPALWIDGQVVANPDYREPPGCRPVDGAMWGPVVLRLSFSAPADLVRLREHVRRAAEAAGLRGETLREAVLATHEAAVLAAGGSGGAGLDPWLVSDPRPDVDPRAVPCVLEVRAGLGFLHCEIQGSPPGGLMSAAEGSLQIVQMFCDRALLHDEAGTRSVRVLRAA